MTIYDQPGDGNTNKSVKTPFTGRMNALVLLHEFDVEFQTAPRNSELLSYY